MNNPIMAIYDYNGRRPGGRTAPQMIQITRFPSRWFTISRRAGVGVGYPAGGPGRFDETDYRQGKV